jgi:hypothetical protein
MKIYSIDTVEWVNGYRDEMFSHGLEPVIITHPNPGGKEPYDYVSMAEY